MGPYEYVVESIQGEYAYLRRTDIYDSCLLYTSFSLT